MHSGRAKIQISGIIIALLLIAGTLLFVVKLPTQNARVANVAASYKWQ